MVLAVLLAVMESDFGRFPFFGVSTGETVLDDDDDEEHSRVNSAQATFLKNKF